MLEVLRSAGSSACYTASPLGASPMTFATLAVQSYPITVGAGGAGAQVQNRSKKCRLNINFNSITSAGGGGGGSEVVQQVHRQDQVIQCIWRWWFITNFRFSRIRNNPPTNPGTRDNGAAGVMHHLTLEVGVEEVLVRQVLQEHHQDK